MCLRRFQGHSDTITALLLTPDNRYLISASRDNTIRLWDIQHNQCANALSGHTEGVLCLALGGGGRPLLSGGGDQVVKVWEPATGELQRTLRGHHAPITALVCTVDGDFALSGARDGDVKLWDTRGGECLHTFKAYDEEVTALTLSRDGAYAFAGYAGGAVTRWFLDWDLNERPPHNWQETVAPFLEAFYTRHLPRKATLPESAKVEAAHLEAALTPLSNRPAIWTPPRFVALLDTLAHAGYGWLTPAEVEAQLLLLRKQKQQGRWYGKMDSLLSKLRLRER